MWRVQISARMVQWPDVCACCCRAADTRVEVSSTRTTGKRVIHSTTKAWSVPYCNLCLEHIQASKDLQSHRIFVWHPSLVISAVGVFLSLILLVSKLVLGLAAFAVTIGVLVLTYKWSRGTYERAMKAKEAEREQLKRRLDSALCATCCEQVAIAAGYEGWHGTVHSFTFASQQFAAAFEQANPGKCLHDGQIQH
jgi:hypothetical protein